MSESIHLGSHLDADQLNAFMEGVLPEHERLQSLAHLAECARCREWVFLAQSSEPEPEPLPVTAEAAPWWKSSFGVLPVAAYAVAGVVLIAFLLHPWRFKMPPPSVDVAKVQPTQTLPVAMPAEQPPEVANATPPKPLRRMPSTTQPQRSPVAPEDSAISGGIAGASSIHGSLAMNGLAFQSGGMSGKGSGAAPSAQRAARPDPSTFDGRLSGSGQGANASATVLSAAPQPARVPQDTVIDNAQLAQLPINGRSVNAAPAAPASNLYSGGPLQLRIEHNHAPSGALSEMRGSVTDPSGAVVPGAAVTARRLVEAASMTTTTDAAGRFSLASLPAGSYEVRIVAPGFTTITQQIELQPRDLAELHSVLPIGAMSQTVTVEASSNEMATESTLPALRATAKKSSGEPGKLPIVTSVTVEDRTLSLNSEGTLFLSRDGGRHWRRVKAVWEGKVSQLALAPLASQDSDSIADSAAAAPTSPAGFQLTTNAHIVWMSEDGVHWVLR